MICANRRMIQGMEAISKTNPERMKAGRKALTRAAWEAMNWLRVMVEIRKPWTEGRQKESRRSDSQCRQRAPEGDAEEENGHGRADRHGRHAEHKVGHELAEDDFRRAQGRCQQCFHGAPLPFPGHHQGGEQGADNGHDDGQ